MPAFYATKMYCHTCKKGYNKITDHLWGESCKSYRFQNCPIISWVHCKDCMRYFKSQECYNRHKETVGNTKSIFESLVKCTKCQKVVKRNLMRPESHNCRLVRCTVCQKYMNIETHQCYLQPERTRASETADSDDMFDSEADENSNDSSYNQLLFFDFECIQESGVHVPNLCVVQDEAGIEHVFKVEIRKMTFVSGCFRKKTWTVSL